MVILLLAGLLAVSLLQLSTAQAEASREKHDRQIAADIAGRFAIALTTYDYAHPAVQIFQLGSVSASVRSRVNADVPDIVGSRASSLGDVTEAVVIAIDGTRAEVLVRTSQIVSNSYENAGAKVEGLLDVSLDRTTHDWFVTDYRWLVVPTNAP